MPDARELALMCRAAVPEATVVEVLRCAETAPMGGVVVQMLDPIRHMVIAWEPDPDHGPGWAWSITRADHWSSGPLTMPEDLGFALCELLGLPAPWASRLAQLRKREGLGTRVAMALAGDPWGLVECGRALAAL